MLSNERHRSFLQTSKFLDMSKQLASGTFSPETTTTTSSGYSTGGSSVSTSLIPALKKPSSSSTVLKEEQQKTKSKGLPNLFTKLKNLLLPSKNKSLHLKSMRSTASREIASTNRLRQHRQQSPVYDVLPSSSSATTNNTISLPFTYYCNSPIRQSKATFEKIAAWLNHTEKMSKNEGASRGLFRLDANRQLSTSLSSNAINQHVFNSLSSSASSRLYLTPELINTTKGITVVKKKTPMYIKPPKRSSSLVTRVTRPIIEQHSQVTLSPSSSFSSSILTKGMSERMTPPPKPDSQLVKPNRRRTVDFSRRRTVTDTHEHQSNKENLTQHKSPEAAYQFPSLSSKNRVEIRIPSKQVPTKKYYFYSAPSKPNEDLLNNSYGLTLLDHRARHSAATAVLMTSQFPNHISSQKQQFTPRTSLKQQPQTMESLDDLLCDREVESYFYPGSSKAEHIYMNFENPSVISSSSIHGTLC